MILMNMQQIAMIKSLIVQAYMHSNTKKSQKLSEPDSDYLYTVWSQNRQKEFLKFHFYT
jgi:hypothetical protein